jgi:hypothetical protein
MLDDRVWKQIRTVDGLVWRAWGPRRNIGKDTQIHLAFYFFLRVWQPAELSKTGRRVRRRSLQVNNLEHEEGTASLQ